MLKEKEVKEIFEALKIEDVKARQDVADVHGGDKDKGIELATAAAMGAIIDRLERYEHRDDTYNWGFDTAYTSKEAAERINEYSAALWAAFRCGYVQALKDRD